METVVERLRAAAYLMRRILPRPILLALTPLQYCYHDGMLSSLANKQGTSFCLGQ